MENSINTQILGRGIAAIILTLALLANMAIGQNLVLKSTTITNTGTMNIKGNINTAEATGAVSILGTVNLNGADTTQHLGVSGNNGLTFSKLLAAGSVAKKADVDVSINDSLGVNITGFNFAILGNTLTLGGYSTLTSGSIDVSDATSTVIYNGASAQTIMGLSYAGSVALSGAGAKNLGDVASVAGAFSHTGGNLTVDKNLTISYATPSFATIDSVTGSSTLALSGDGDKSIAAITTISSGSVLSNTGSGVMTVTALNGNAGMINGGAGGATFTNAATNGGNITGGAGAVTFSNALAHSAGTITAGAGGIVFTGDVTQTGGSIASSALADVLNFNANVANSGGTIDLTSTGAAQFAGTVNAAGLSFANGTTVTYDGASAGQAIADVNYGNLILTTNTKSWTLGADRTISNNLDIQASSATTVNADYALNVSGNITLASNLTKSNSTVVFANATSTVSGAGEIIGAVNRNHLFAAATPYTFNRDSVTLAVASDASLNVTLTNNAATAPSAGSGRGTRYINRQYIIAGANFASNAATLKLYYNDADRTGSPTESRLVFKRFAAGAWSTLAAGTYTRNVAGDPNEITLASITNDFTSATELGMILSGYVTVASNTWNNPLTWEGGDIPTATDDATIAATHNVTVPVVSTIANLTIEATGNLAVDGADFNATSINNAGGINVNVNRTLTVNGGDLTNAGSITNDGTVTVQ